MIPLEISMRMVSEIVDCGTSTLATGHAQREHALEQKRADDHVADARAYARAADQDRRGRVKPICRGAV